MAKFAEKEKQELKLQLLKQMEIFMKKVTEVDNEIGYIPDNIEALMADAAFAVLETVNATNHYFETEDMLK